MVRRAATVVVLVALMGASACGGRSGKRSGGGAAAPLEGTQWVLDQKASTLETLAPNVTVTAAFAKGQLSGNAGCNQYSTSYKVSGSSLTVSKTIASTRKLCGAPADNVESAYLERLPTVTSYAIAGKVLTLHTTTKGADLVYDATDASSAVAGKWDVTSYFRPGAIVSVIVGTELTADFEHGTVSGNGGCNTYSGPYTTDGSAIHIGPLASTLKACADAAVNQQETDYLAALQLATSYQLGSNGLTLLRADGGIAVTLARPAK